MRGVTSNSSSSETNASDSSRLILTVALRRFATSAVDDRMLVSFFSLHTLISMSPSRTVGADNHSFIDRSPRVDECITPALGVNQAVSNSHAAFRRHKRAASLGLYLALHRLVGRKYAALHPVAAGGPKKEGVESDQSPSRYLVLHVDVTVLAVP